MKTQPPRPRRSASGTSAPPGAAPRPTQPAREPKPIETLLARATGQRGSPAGKGRRIPSASGGGQRMDKRRAVSNQLQSRHRSARGRKAA
ncbi:MAG: hypothetical protein ACRD2F_03880 [Terriglobales bacterium]